MCVLTRAILIALLHQLAAHLDHITHQCDDDLLDLFVFIHLLQDYCIVDCEEGVGVGGWVACIGLFV